MRALNEASCLHSSITLISFIWLLCKPRSVQCTEIVVNFETNPDNPQKIDLYS